MLTNNLEIGIMKTETQVSDWLHQQRWLMSFVKNIRSLTFTSREEAQRILSGAYKDNTIAAGFDWSRSPQGPEYWREKHNELKEWYYGS